MDGSSVFEACKAELEAAGQIAALRAIQALEGRMVGSSSKQPRIPLPPKKSASFVACTLCRKCKAKCVISQPGASRCDRCRQAGCECIFQQHKRGRKPTRGLDLPRAAPSPTDNDSFRTFQSISPRRDTSQQSHTPPDLMNSNSDASTSALPSLVPNNEMLSTDDDDDMDVVQPPITHSAAHPLPFISGSHRPFTIQSMLNPVQPTPPPSQDGRDFALGSVESNGAAGIGALGDPLSRGLLSLGMAQQLFAFFFERLNPIVMLFDPTLHSFEYVRHKSSFLFSAMLSSSAKFIAPDVCKPLSQMAMDYSLRAVFVSGRSLETIQAWMIIYFWKAPRDNRAWMYVGLACRMGVELGLDCTPIHDTPGASELDQRERRNRQRTWMLAFMMDRAMASATGRDWMVRGRDAVVQNHRLFSDHPLRIPGDAVVGGFTELRLISSEAVDLLYPGVAAASSRAEVDVTRELLRVNYDLKLWLQYWTIETERFNQTPIYLALLRLFGLHVQLTLNSFAIPHANSVASSLRALPGTGNQTPEKYCYDLAIQNLKQLWVIHDIDGSILRYMQDSISIMVAYAACFLRKVINDPQFQDDERRNAVLLIFQTSEMFREASLGPTDTAALQAQFLHSLAEHSQYIIQPQQQPLQRDIQSDVYRSPPALDIRRGVSTTVEPTIPGINIGVASAIPQSITPDDLSNLDGATWDQIMAGWMANPNTNSLQYKDFVTNFLSSSFVDVQQHRLTEFPDQFAYGS